MTSSLKRRLDKLGAELPTFMEWLAQGGYGEGEIERALKKNYEKLRAALLAA